MDSSDWGHPFANATCTALTTLEPIDNETVSIRIKDGERWTRYTLLVIRSMLSVGWASYPFTFNADDLNL